MAQRARQHLKKRGPCCKRWSQTVKQETGCPPREEASNVHATGKRLLKRSEKFSGGRVPDLFFQKQPVRRGRVHKG